MNDNCNTCRYKTNKQGEWCYMFEVEPKEECLIYSDKSKVYSPKEIDEQMKVAFNFFAKLDL